MGQNQHDRTLSDQTFEFLAAAQAAASPPALNRAFSDRISSLGYDSFVCAQIPGAGGAPTRDNFTGQWDPLWEAHYMAHQLYRDDPALSESMRRTDPFAWSDIGSWRALRPEEQRVLNDARDFGYTEGFTTPIRNLDGSLALVVLFGREVEDDQRARNALHIMSLYYAGATRRIQHDRAMAQAIRLTGREREILTLLAAGRRQGDIADRLGISERTVEHHIENARRRVGASTSVQLCVEAVRLGLIFP